MKTQLENIYKAATSDLEKAVGVNDIEEIKMKYLSRKGEFNSIKKGLKDLSDEDKRIVGALANEITQKLESAIKEKFDIFYRQEMDAKLKQDKIDITLDGSYIPHGKIHPITATVNEIV